MNRQQDTLPFNQQFAQNFDEFISNDSVIEVLQHPENLPQFVYVWGDEHSGKTHLISALENSLNEAGVVCFAVGATYLTETNLIQLLPAGLGYLLLDDVQVIAGQSSAEVAFFNLFNHCKAKGISMVVTASIHNKSKTWQLPDLISRLHSGLTLKLDVLQGQAAMSCIVRQFEINGIPLDDVVIQYLQTHHSSNYAELYRLFLHVSNESLKLKRKVTVPLLKQIVHQSSTSTDVRKNTGP